MVTFGIGILGVRDLLADLSETLAGVEVEQGREGNGGSNEESEDGPFSVVRERAVGDFVGAIDAQITVAGNRRESGHIFASTGTVVVRNGSRGSTEHGRAGGDDNKVVGDVLARSQSFPTCIQDSSLRREIFTQP